MLVVSKYKAPSAKAFPSLSTVGLLDLAPKKSSSKVSKAASAAFFAFSAAVAEVAAALAEVAAAVAELAAAVAFVATPDPSIVASSELPSAENPKSFPALDEASSVISGVLSVAVLETFNDLSNSS